MSDKEQEFWISVFYTAMAQTGSAATAATEADTALAALRAVRYAG